MHHLPENNTSQVQGSVIQPVGISGHETSTHSSTGNITTTTSSIGKTLLKELLWWILTTIDIQKYETMALHFFPIFEYNFWMQIKPIFIVTKCNRGSFYTVLAVCQRCKQQHQFLCQLWNIARAIFSVKLGTKWF